MEYKIGDLFELEILSCGAEGEGVARLDGRVVFVPSALEGEKVKVKLVEIKKDFFRARVVKVLRASQGRVEPPCKLCFTCGGCDLMHASSDEQRTLKTRAFVDNMKKIAGLEVPVSEFVASDKALGYRNKVQLPFGIADGRVVVGYFRRGTHTVVPCEDCLLHGEWARPIISAVLDYANACAVGVYDETSGKGLLRHLVVRNAAGHISVVIVINGEGLPKFAHLEKALEGKAESISISVNKRNTNVIMGDSVKTLRGPSASSCEITGVKAEVSPLAFLQVNDYICGKLYAKAIELLADVKVCVDLFSGIGITSNLLARGGRRVYCVEIVPDAVRDARRTARLNGNQELIDIICGDAARELPRLAREFVGEEVGVLLDPPRKGCQREVCEALAVLKPKTIVYISCNHATLARDIKLLEHSTEGGYSIDYTGLYDMFPNSHHVEALVLLSRR